MPLFKRGLIARLVEEPIPFFFEFGNDFFDIIEGFDMAMNIMLKCHFFVFVVLLKRVDRLLNIHLLFFSRSQFDSVDFKLFFIGLHTLLGDNIHGRKDLNV